MNIKVLEQFLSEDADIYVRRKLLEAIKIQKERNAPALQEFNFNRFNIYINFETKLVTVQDDLTIGTEGEHKLKLEEFENALQQSKLIQG